MRLHVAELARLVPHVARLAARLSPDERDRAARFVFPHHRDRFIAARGVLRALLAEELGRPDVVITAGVNDKPLVDGVYFNLSHTRRWLAIAVDDREIGVDCEDLRPLDDRDALAPLIATPEEQRAVDALPEGGRDAALLRCWTRKEAVLKADGTGLSQPMTSFSVDVNTDAVQDVALRGRRWRVLPWVLDRAVGAIASARLDATLGDCVIMEIRTVAD